MRFLNLYSAVFGWRVKSGPFRGMHYVRDSVCSALAPKLLGTYEKELHPWIEGLIRSRPEVLLNIGAAEGYYAVGLARRCPELRVIAFETEEHGRTLLGQLAGMNGVADRLLIESTCTTELLRETLAANPGAVLIVDIEGAETILLDPVQVPALAECPFLVELHEDQHPAGEILRTRFSDTHQIEEHWTKARTLQDLSWSLRLLARLSAPRRFLAALEESRPGPMHWFLCQPKSELRH